MRIMLQQIPSQVKIEESLLAEAINKYNTVYNNSCYILYNLYFSESPSYYDNSEVFRAFVQSYPDTIQYLNDYSNCKTSLTKGGCLYASMASEDSDAKVAYKAVYSLLCADESLKALGGLVDIKFTQKTRTHNVKLKEVFNPYVIDKSKYNMFLDCMWDSIKEYRDAPIHKVNYMRCLMDSLVDYLDIDTSEYLSYINKNQSILIKGVTHTQELDLLPYILKGDLPLFGVYGHILYDNIKEYYDNDRHKACEKTHQLSYYYNIMAKCSNMLNKCCAELRESATSLGWSPLYVTETELWFYKPESISKIRYMSTEFEVGAFLFDHKSGAELDILQQMLGYCGEYYHIDELSPKKHDVINIPISIPEKLVSATGIFYKDSDNKIFTSLGLDIIPEVRDIPEDKLNRFEASCGRFATQGEVSEIRIHMQKTLLSLLTGKPIEGYSTPYEVKLQNPCSYEDYYEACVMAIKRGKVLGILD